MSVPWLGLEYPEWSSAAEKRHEDSLVNAIKASDEPSVREMITRGVYANGSWQGRKRALITAILTKNDGIAQLLIGDGGETPISSVRSSILGALNSGMSRTAASLFKSLEGGT